MAESGVSFLLDNITPLLQNEVQLLSGIPEQVQYMVYELQHIKAFLKDADSNKKRTSGLKVLVKQVRDVEYDIEDVLNEYELHLIYGDDHGFCSLCYFINTLKTRHRIASEVQSIRSRVSSISESHERFKSTNPRSSSKMAYRQLTFQGDALLLEEADLVGIVERKKHLIDWLLSNETGRQVISVVGMGGMGKTTLVKQVYDDPKVRKRFKVHSWITVSRLYNIDDLIEDMVQQIFTVIGKPVPQTVSKMNRYQKREIIKDSLQQSRYLIVLDSVWDAKFWDFIKHALPSRKKYGSRVIMTTRNASCIEIHDKVYNLEPLSPEESLDLLCKKTFQGRQCPSHLKEICQCILNRCGGLPLAIVAISAVLAMKDEADVDEWEMLCRTFGPEIGDNQRLHNMNRVLALSYNDLPYYLEPCFLYLSMFPDFQKIETMRLKRQWIAEGFVIEKEGMTPEEVAEGYIKELLDRNLIQVAGKTSYGKIKSCKMHDLLREIVIQESKDQNFGAVVKEEGANLPDKIRRLSVVKTLQNVQYKDLSRLRSLLVFSEKDSLTEIPRLFPRGIRLLKVLDLTGAPLEDFPEEACKLFHLKYLNLRKTKVKHIPPSIKNLQNLQTLNLKDSLVTELPVEILRLKRLRHLLVYRYEIESYVHFDSKFGVKAPSGIGCLQSLQKLCFIEGNQENLAELGKLNQLRRLGITKFRETDGSTLCSSIQNMINLRSLSITSEDKTNIIDLHHISSPPRYLQRLYLAGHMEKLPHWINSLQNLAKLFLKWSRLKEDPLVHLQHLPNLVHLEFLKVYEGESFHFKAGGFPRLKILGLDKLDALQSLTVDEGAMPHLKKLTFQRCKNLKKVPSGIEFLTNLKLLEFFDMPDELIMKLRPDGGEAHSKVAHVSAVYIVYWLGDGWDVYSLERFTERDTSTQSSEIRSYRRSTLWKV